MTDRIDDWINKPTARDIAAGDPAKASESIKNARHLWERMRKAETLDKIQERALNKVGANYTSAGMQTALRQEFRNLANSPKFSRFSKEEQALVRQIVRGASGENLLRYLGKFAPTSPISAMVSMFVGAPGGVVGQAALMGAGTAARNASARMGASKVNELNALVRRGYTEGGASY
jgi:CheY-specific phosphatase CheX